MKSWLEALARTRDTIVRHAVRIFTGDRAARQATRDEWEEALIAADVPARLAAEFVRQAEALRDGGALEQRLEQVLVEGLGHDPGFAWDLPTRPYVVLIAGVNGSGKTTTCAKLAAMAKARGLKPLLAATDTFRAAGTDQLRIWAERVGCDVVAGVQGADAASVAYDALSAAQARHADIVFVDTAGRMHTKQTLMDELQKVKRAMAKCLPGAPHAVWMVLDATLGNNALMQARVFHEAVGLSGLVISKLDGSAKAGSILAARREVGAPILFVGLGEGMDDLAPFDPPQFVKAMLGTSA
jgi:fused signal recognition particle receptor